ncbi:unnamed protein product [Adineta ricciae]|uniref:Uncharacterized protein n=1 Tax=Adineta ricciae TaxID=249248 RepID=A0A814DDK4_ADIRI|nr:unnamed protein product [Adineta ricciae]CAF1397037.1 unnamed protein product [Adineta ricciae]
MDRLRRKFSKLKNKSNPTSDGSVYKKHGKNDDQTYLDTKNGEIFSITSSIDYIAEELFAIAKKSSHTIRLSKLHDDLLHLKVFITKKFKENSEELVDSNRQISVLKRQLNKQSVDFDLDPESSLNTRYNRSFASDRSMADSTSHHSLWSPNSIILSSSLTTPTFRRRLAETSMSDINHSSVIQEHFVYLYQQLCSNCSKCSCYQSFIRNQIELEYLSICSYNEQIKSENDCLQRLLADCKHAYEQQYVLFSQYEQYLIEYEQCIQIQYELIKALQQFVDRYQISFDQRKHTINTHDDHLYLKPIELITKGARYETNDSGLYQTISLLQEQCQRHISQLPKRAQLFSYSHEQFHPPPNISGVVDVADLEISILLVDLLTLKHENNELRWTNDRFIRETKLYKSRLAVLELTNRYFDKNFVIEDSSNELIQREKALRLYVYRLSDLLQTTSNQLEERQTYYETLVRQLKVQHKELVAHIRQNDHK